MTIASDVERYMLDLVNAERMAAGLQPLKLEQHLNTSSEDHSQWVLQEDQFSHTGENGSSSFTRMADAGFVFSGSWRSGENIGLQSERGAAGFFDDVEDIHDRLMASSGHRANILNPGYEYIGIGVEVGEYDGFQVVMITQNFADTDGPVLLDTGGGGNGSGAIVGGDGVNVLVGTRIAELIQGLGGNDDLRGRAGADTLEGGNGADEIRGHKDDDAMDGGAGKDALLGGNGSDTVHGGGGNDTAKGHAGADTLFGEGRADRLFGNKAGDMLFGGAGNDRLFGQIGNDSLSGGGGKDTLIGGAGTDILYGDAGEDVFLFRHAEHSVVGSDDIIKDFERGIDVIDLGHVTPGELDFITGGFTGSGPEARIGTSGVDTLVWVDIDGDGAADMRITVEGVTGMAENDFVL